MEKSLLYFLFSFLSATAAQAPSAVLWGSCPPNTPPGVDCGTIKAPLAYNKGKSLEANGSGTVTLGLVRLNSTGNSSNPQPLFFNPGGPGVPATQLVAAGQFVPNLGFSSDVRAVYDIIGLDPRGSGSSTPVKCDPAIFNERVPTFVSNNASYTALVDHNRRLGETCRNLTGPLLANVDTISVAKDHEIVRKALGADKFNLFGLSYGSLLGTEYINLFPENIGRMALDGIVDNSGPEVFSLLAEATAYETTLNEFFKWCDTNSTCPLNKVRLNGTNIANGVEGDGIMSNGTNGNGTMTLSGIPRDPYFYNSTSKDAFDMLITLAQSRPIPAPSCNGTCQPNVTAEDIRYNMQSYLQFVDFPYSPNWISLGRAIAEALRGNATAFSTSLATSQTSPGQEGSPFSYLAVGCQDWKHSARNYKDLVQRLEAVQTFAPQTGGASQTFYYQSACIGWPAPLREREEVLNANMTSRAPPVLLATAVYDPLTSIVWANGVRQQLPSAVSIARNGSGHTSHFVLGDTRDAIDRYLATGDLPADGTIYQT